MNALIIDDDVFLATCLKKSFEEKMVINRIQILSSYDSYIAESHTLPSYDIVIVDILLWKWQEKTGIDIIKHIRSKNPEIPLIVLSGLSDITRLEKSFFAWANDYVTKPFRMEELELRISRWFEDYYCSRTTLPYPRISYHWFSFDVRKNAFFYNDEELNLTKTHKYILSIFLAYPETVFSDSDLKGKVWGDIFWAVERNIRIHLFRLKKRLDKYEIGDWILKVRWEGHMLKKPNYGIRAGSKRK